MPRFGIQSLIHAISSKISLAESRIWFIDIELEKRERRFWKEVAIVHETAWIEVKKKARTKNLRTFSTNIIYSLERVVVNAPEAPTWFRSCKKALTDAIAYGILSSQRVGQCNYFTCAIILLALQVRVWSSLESGWTHMRHAAQLFLNIARYSRAVRHAIDTHSQLFEF